MSKNEELELISEYLEGDESAFEKLIDLHMNSIYKFVYGFLGNSKDSEDVTQEIFLKVWKNIKRYDSKFPFKSWLFKIAKNTVFDFLREKKSSRVDFNDDLLLDVPDEKDFPELVVKKTESEKLKKKMELLPYKYRVILTLHFIEDLPFKDISDILSEPFETVKTRLRRGVVQLRSYFDK